jgi:uncharacterized protein DUF3618
MDRGQDELTRTAVARADVERSRARLERTIDALEDRLTPGALMAGGADLLKTGAGSGARRLITLARTHPVRTAVVLLGLAFVAKKVRSRRALQAREELSQRREGLAPVAYAILLGARKFAERLADRRE